MRPTRETFKSRCSRLLQDNAAHLKLLRNNLEKYLSELTLDFIYFGKFSAIKNCKFQPFQPLYPLAQNYSEHWGLTLFNHHHTTSQPSHSLKIANFSLFNHFTPWHKIILNVGVLPCSTIIIPLHIHHNWLKGGYYFAQPSSYLWAAILTANHLVHTLCNHHHTSAQLSWLIIMWLFPYTAILILLCSHPYWHCTFQ